MILAAGRGERLRPITDHLPKPLITVGKHALIEYHLIKLARSGFKHVVINVSYHSEMIIKTLGDGSRYGLRIRYAQETDGPLGTAGGILNALDLFDHDQILVVNADIFTDYQFINLNLPEGSDAHLVLVNNPEHNRNGDFFLNNDALTVVSPNNESGYTFSGIAAYRKSLFESMNNETRELKEVFHQLVDIGAITGEFHTSLWIDVGDPNRLALARQAASKNSG